MLGASHTTDDYASSASTFSALSAFIWGLVLQKARKGVEAAGSKDTQTVSGLLKKGGMLVFMIAAASLCTFMANVNETPASLNTSNAAGPLAVHPKLAASHEQQNQ